MREYRNRAEGDVQARPSPEHRDAKTNNPATLFTQGSNHSLGSEYGLGPQYGLGNDTEVGLSVAGTSQISVEQEYRTYSTEQRSQPSLEILKFWEVRRTRRTSDIRSIANRTSQVNGSRFPTLLAMAMDYLPVQATSVSCERVFSSSAETDTKRQNRIHPFLMEALQMVKFHLKKERLNFTSSWVTEEKEMDVDDPDTDLLGELTKGTDNKAVLDQIQDDLMKAMDGYEK